MKRTNIGALIAAGTLAGSLITVTAPTALAKPIAEKTIKSHCKAARGEYSTYVSQGHRYSSCGYRDISGDYWIDYYTDGEYTGTI